MASAKAKAKDTVPDDAFLYVIGVPHGRPYKIGFSYVPDARAKDQQRKGRDGAYVVACRPLRWNIALCAERYAHWLLRAHHIDHEWFDVTREEAIAAIEKATAPEMLAWYSTSHMIPATQQPKTKIPQGEYIYTKFPKGTRERFHALLGDKGHSDFVRAAVLGALDEAEAVDPSPPSSDR